MWPFKKKVHWYVKRIDIYDISFGGEKWDRTEYEVPCAQQRVRNATRIPALVTCKKCKKIIEVKGYNLDDYREKP